MHHTQNKNLAECIEICGECRDECHDILFNHCLEKGGKFAEKEHIKLLVDCIQACQTAEGFMKRDSTLYAAECAVCAEVCDACAVSCERIGGEELKRCAEACRRCAQSCRDVGKMKKAA